MAQGLEVAVRYHANSLVYVTGSVKRGCITFPNFQVGRVITHHVFNPFLKITFRNSAMLGV